MLRLPNSKTRYMAGRKFCCTRQGKDIFISINQTKCSDCQADKVKANMKTYEIIKDSGGIITSFDFNKLKSEVGK